MAQIKMLVDRRGPVVHYARGAVLKIGDDISKEEAARLVGCGHAEDVGNTARQTATKKAPTETRKA